MTQSNKNNWSVKDFVDRWFRQSNYPLVSLRIQSCNGADTCLSIEQARAINIESSIFAGSTPYPSPYKYEYLFILFH